MFGVYSTKRDAFKCSVKESCYIDCKLLLTASTKACITSSRWQVAYLLTASTKALEKTVLKQQVSRHPVREWRYGMWAIKKV